MVSIVKYDKTGGSIRRAVELVNGFGELRKDAKVMIKPNGVGCDPAIPYFGMMTTATVVEEIIRMLLDFGCAPKNITIGEGAAARLELMLGTRMYLRAMGMNTVAKKYGVKIIDFNASPKRTLEVRGNKYEIAAPALDTDFMINVPVPKYHEQTTVSLSLKNLKGCISPESKKKCHNIKLQDNIAEFNTKIPCHLTIMDGIYMLRHGGPFVDTGVPCRKDMLMAGTNHIEIDSAGCWILGVDPASVRHIALYAELMGREGELGKFELVGDDPEQFREGPFVYEKEPFYHAFKKAEVTGLKIHPPGQTWCTGCNISLRASLYLMCKDNQGREFDDVEILVGKQCRSKGGHKKSIVFGDCPIKANKDNDILKDSLVIGGCPPTFMKAYPALLNYTMPKEDARTQLIRNFTLGSLARAGLYNMKFPFLSDFPAEIFDPADFKRKA